MTDQAIERALHHAGVAAAREEVKRAVGQLTDEPSWREAHPEDAVLEAIENLIEQKILQFLESLKGFA